MNNQCSLGSIQTSYPELWSKPDTSVHVNVFNNCARNRACLPSPVHDNNDGYTQAWFMTHKAATLPWVVEGPFFSAVCANHKIWSTGSAVISLWGLVLFASFDWHFCDLATTGACTCSHHSNNPLESAEKKSLVPLCSLAKCQESSAGSSRGEVDRQSSAFVPDSVKEPIHYSCSHWRFLQVSTGF